MLEESWSMMFPERKVIAMKGDLDLYMKTINSVPMMTREEELKIALRYQKRRRRADRDALVQANLRFVVKVAHQYKGYGFPLLDLVQEGNIGLIRAVEKFNPKRGFRIISYSVWWIRALIQNYILSAWSLVKMGKTQASRTLFYKLRSERAKLLPNEEDPFGKIAESLGVPKEAVEEMEWRLAAREASLDMPITDTGSENPKLWVDMLVDPNETPDVAVEEAERKQHLREVVKAISERFKTPSERREWWIIERRLMGEDKITLQEIGEHFNVSRERARQIEYRAITKVRKIILAKYPYLVNNLKEVLENMAEQRRKVQASYDKWGQVKKDKRKESVPEQTAA